MRRPAERDAVVRQGAAGRAGSIADSATPTWHASVTGSAPFPAPADTTLLAAAEAAGLQLASSCRAGTCRTCMRRLLAGAVVYRMEWPGLLAEEKADGWILPCVAYPASDVVIA